MPSPYLTSADVFCRLSSKNPDGYRPDKKEKRNAEPGEFGPKRLEKLAAAVVSLKNETPEELARDLSLITESVLLIKKESPPEGTTEPTGDSDLRTEEKIPLPRAARVLTQDCSGIQLLDVHSRLPHKSDERRISSTLIHESFTPHFIKKNIKRVKKNAESLGPFVQSLDFERCLEIPNYVRLSSYYSHRHHSLDLIALDEEGRKLLDALGPEAKKILNSSNLHFIRNLVAGDPQWKEFIDYLNNHWKRLLSFEGAKFVSDDLSVRTDIEFGKLHRSWLQIKPVSDRAMDDKQEVLQKMASCIKSVFIDFLWVESALKADFFSGNDTDMATRFPLSFVLEQAFDYPEKRIGFKVASKVMTAVSQLCENSSVNSNYLFNQAINSLLCKEKFWRNASPEWRNLLIKSGVFPIDTLCHEDDRSHPLDRSPLFLACRFSPYASDIQALFEAGASPNQDCTLKNNGSVCEWSAGVAANFLTLGAVGCLMLTHSEIPQIEKKLDHILNHPDFANFHKMGIPLQLAILKRAPASLIEKLIQHPVCDVNWRSPEGISLPVEGLTALELAIQKALFDDHDNQDVCSGQSDLTESTNSPIAHWTEVIQLLARQGAGLDENSEGSIQDINRLFETVQEHYETDQDNGHGLSPRVLLARKKAIKEAIEQGWYEKAMKELLS